MKECGIGYGSVNHPVDRDPICGFTGVIDDVCPRCGRHEGEAVSIGRLNELRKKYPDVPVYLDAKVAVSDRLSVFVMANRTLP